MFSSYAKFLVICLILPMGEARETGNLSEESYKQARYILQAAAEVLGDVNRIKNFKLVEKGKLYRIDHPSPDPGFDVTEWHEETVIDFARSRLFHDVRAWDERTILDGAHAFGINVPSSTAWPIEGASLEKYSDLMIKLPHFLLREVFTANAASLRRLPDTIDEGRKQRVITFSNKSGRQTALYLDAQNNLLTKYEFLYTDSGSGDSRQEFLFHDYTQVNEFLVPTRATTRIDGKTSRDVRYELEINAVVSDKLFALPENTQKLPTSYYPEQAMEINQIANDLYLIQGVGGESNVLVVAFDNSLLVVESPEFRTSSDASGKVIKKIKEKIPNRPIRYHLFTHYHLDHSGGTRAYVAEGATIVTTPGNKEFVEKMATAPFTFNPDELALHPRNPVIEIIQNKKHIIRDQNHVVELYDIGPYPHAKEELIVYLPKQKFLFEGDLFTSGFIDALPAATKSTVLLLEKIRDLKLDVIQIAGVHGRVRPISDLHNSVERFQEQIDPVKSLSISKTQFISSSRHSNLKRLRSVRRQPRERVY